MYSFKYWIKNSNTYNNVCLYFISKSIPCPLCKHIRVFLKILYWIYLVWWISWSQLQPFKQTLTWLCYQWRIYTEHFLTEECFFYFMAFVGTFWQHFELGFLPIELRFLSRILDPPPIFIYGWMMGTECWVYRVCSINVDDCYSP